MSKYSALTHELAEINLCLKNLDGTPQRTNQSHQADETVHAINTHPAPGIPTGSEAGFVCLFTCLSVWSIGGGGNHLQECAVGSA